jgi:hypothetical protein
MWKRLPGSACHRRIFVSAQMTGVQGRRNAPHVGHYGDIVPDSWSSWFVYYFTILGVETDPSRAKSHVYMPVKLIHVSKMYSSLYVQAITNIGCIPCPSCKIMVSRVCAGVYGRTSSTHIVLSRLLAAIIRYESNLKCIHVYTKFLIWWKLQFVCVRLMQAYLIDHKYTPFWLHFITQKRGTFIRNTQDYLSAW